MNRITNMVKAGVKISVTLVFVMLVATTVTSIVALSYRMPVDSTTTLGTTVLTPYSEPPEIVYVDDDFNESTPGWDYDHFNTITDGVLAVAVNGTVNVAEGVYREQVTIEQPLLLKGEHPSITIIDGQNTSDDTVAIRSPYVEITRFTIRNGSTGVACHSHHITVKNNIIRDNYEWGVVLWGFESYQNIVTGNTIAENGHETPETISFGGIYLSVSASNRIMNNNFYNNTDSNAFFFKSIFNLWLLNYWDRPRLLPYPILGFQAIIPPIFWFQFDLRPRLQPYEL
jgi:parallel beta-helix repeat protein